MRRRFALAVIGIAIAPFASGGACGDAAQPDRTGPGSQKASSSVGAQGGGGSSVSTNIGVGGGRPCEGDMCAPDLQSIIDCDGNTVQECNGTDGCDLETVTCINACEAADNAQRSVGCDYYATFMD